MRAHTSILFMRCVALGARDLGGAGVEVVIGTASFRRRLDEGALFVVPSAKLTGWVVFEMARGLFVPARTSVCVFFFPDNECASPAEVAGPLIARLVGARAVGRVGGGVLGGGRGGKGQGGRRSEAVDARHGPRAGWEGLQRMDVHRAALWEVQLWFSHHRQASTMAEGVGVAQHVRRCTRAGGMVRCRERGGMGAGRGGVGRDTRQMARLGAKARVEGSLTLDPAPPGQSRRRARMDGRARMARLPLITRAGSFLARPPPPAHESVRKPKKLIHPCPPRATRQPAHGESARRVHRRQHSCHPVPDPSSSTPLRRMLHSMSPPALS